jgi:PAS domain S-box-containing protein
MISCLMSDKSPSSAISESPPTELDRALILVDASGCLRRLNACAARFTGRPAAELIGMPLDEVLRLAGKPTPAPSQWWMRLPPDTSIEVVGSNNKMPLLARIQQLDDGGESWCLLELRPAGRTRGPSGDGTESSGSNWLDSYELAFHADGSGRFLAVSHSFARKFGRLAPLWRGETSTSLLHPDDAAAWSAALESLLRPPHRNTFEHRWRTPQGWRWIAWDLSAQHDADGKVIAVKATGSDVTKRRLAEEQFLRLSCAVEQSPVSILITDPEGRVQYANRKFTESNGHSMEEILDHNLDPLRTGHADDEAYQRFWQTLRAKGEWSGELCLTQGQGKSVWESVRVSSIRNGAGEITNLLCLREDITERKTLEEQLRQSQKMESLGTLAGGIAHDFNNMLAIIHGYAELGLSRVGDQDEKLRKYLREVHGAAQRACGLVRQILIFSRKTEVHFTLVSLQELVRELAALLGETFPRTVALDLDLDDLLPDLRGDQNQLQQVIMNLCVNARDAMPSGGTLSISLRRVAGQTLQRFNADPTLYYACLEVSDTGIGMPPEVQARIFEPFFTTKQTAGGTGLGLAVVYGIILNHFGFIDVKSKPGHGSTFSVFLPLTSAKAGMPPVATTFGEFPAGTESVMVVEDEQSLRGLLSLILTQKGYKVQVAADGLSAAELLVSSQTRIDVILLDFNMPGMDGIQVYKTVLKTHPNAKVIVISGNLSVEAKAEFTKLGQRDFLEKPFRLEDVGQRIRRVLAPPSP